MGAMYEKGQTKRYSRVASFSGGGKSKKPMSDEDVEATEESEANPFGKGTTKVLNESKKMAFGGATKMRPKSRPMPRPMPARDRKMRPGMQPAKPVPAPEKPTAVRAKSRRMPRPAKPMPRPVKGPRSAPGMAKGGETKKMMKKEVAFMKKKGAPKSMIKHEEREMKGAKGAKRTKRYSGGGGVSSRADGCAARGKTKGAIV